MLYLVKLISVKGGATENMRHSKKCEWTYKITKQEYAAYLSESFKIGSQFLKEYTGSLGKKMMLVSRIF